MSIIWTAADAVQATHGQTQGDWAATGVSIDTRDLQPGDLFVALSDQRDGHDFVAQAFKKGAAAALVSHVPKGVAKDAPLLVVKDVQAALEGLARFSRARTKAKIIAVTGSVGKTSTKDMLAHVLAVQGKVHAAVLSLNNHWGVPLTLARMPVDCDFAVIEIGMNHPGEIGPLAKLARPDVALITTVAEAHMAAFDAIEDIARAKAEIFEGVVPGSIAILNRDITTYDLLAKAAKIAGATCVNFGQTSLAEFHLKTMSAQSRMTAVQADIHGQPCLFKIGASGQHSAMNALAVLAAVDAVGGDLAIAALDLGGWHPPAGRGERQWIGLDPVEKSARLELIDDAYNANPASMASAFDVLAAAVPVDGLGRIARGRRIAILSDMLELGEDEKDKHKMLANLPSLAAVDIVHLAGPLMQHLHAALSAEKRGEWHDSAEKLAQGVHRLLDAGDVVMVKGSKGSRAALVVDAIKKLGQAEDK